MKATKLILWAVMAVMAVACQANENKSAAVTEATPAAAPAASQKTEAAVRQRVEAMKLVEYKDQDQILTKGLMKEIAHAHSIFNISESDLYVGFEWAPGLLDVCGDKEPEVKIDKVNLIDDNRATVDMLYLDKPCYEIPYQLLLLWEDGAWKIDDVGYGEQEEGWGTLRDQCDTYYNIMVESYKNDLAQDVFENILSWEPTEENYNDPGTIYYNNPKELQHLIEQIKNSLELFKQNPGYKPEMGKKINEMLERVKKHL